MGGWWHFQIPGRQIVEKEFFRFCPMWWFYEDMTIDYMQRGITFTLIGVGALGVDRPSETDGDISDV